MQLQGISFLAKALSKRVRKKWDIVLAITGEEGVGKSTLAIQLARMIDPKFSINRNIIFAPNETKVKEKMIELDEYSVIIIDEAVKIFYKLNWQSKMQKFLNILFSLARKERKIVILCIPNFRDLNKFMREHRIRLWVHLIKRGEGVIFMRDWSNWAKDIWWMDENQTIIDKARRYKKLVDFSSKDKLKLLSKARTYVGIVEFDQLDKQIEMEYEEERDKTKYDEIDIGESLTPTLRKTLDNLGWALGELKARGMTQKHMAEKMTRAESDVSYILHSNSNKQ